MERTLTLTRFIVLVGVFGILLGSLAGYVLSTVETVELVTKVTVHILDPNLEIYEVTFIRLVDGYLIATGLLIFGLGLFEIFIHPLDLPKALQFETLGQLKTSLANIIVLTLGVSFLSVVQEDAEPTSILLGGAGIAIIIIALVFFARTETEIHE